jgi:tetratricopeptide (TPR) repeat protein
MKRISGSIATVAYLILISVPAAASAQPSAPAADSMTAGQARRAIIASAAYMDYLSGKASARVDRNNIRFTPDTFEYDVTSNSGTEHHAVDLKAMEPLSVYCDNRDCILRNQAGKRLPNEMRKDLEGLEWGVLQSNLRRCPQECVQAAKNFVAALNRLHVLATDNGAAWNQFRQQAAAWRALATKPPLPDAVRIQRIAAEDAIKNSHPDAAMDYYEAGLAQYPTWPEGHFNAALIAAELGDYTDATEHMKSYLELLPNAPDAQSARDQLDLWQLKAKEHKPAESK